MGVIYVWITTVALLLVTACSFEEHGEPEDPIRAIQNAQLLRDANAPKAPKIAKEETVASKPLPRKQAPTNSDTQFAVNQATGKIDFVAEVVYFEFNAWRLTPAGKRQLQSLATYMETHPDIKLNIEGHCDERGSSEYNLELGQKRSEAIRKHMVSLNVERSRMGTLSFGKQRPAVTGESEEAWAKNRRAEFSFSSELRKDAH